MRRLVDGQVSTGLLLAPIDISTAVGVTLTVAIWTHHPKVLAAPIVSIAILVIEPEDNWFTVPGCTESTGIADFLHQSILESAALEITRTLQLIHDKEFADRDPQVTWDELPRPYRGVPCLICEPEVFTTLQDAVSRIMSQLHVGPINDLPR
jgi:hypothetical protein